MNTQPKIPLNRQKAFWENRGYQVETHTPLGDTLVKFSRSGKKLSIGDTKIFRKDEQDCIKYDGWDKLQLWDLLKSSSKACERALMLLYNAQTLEERRRGESYVSNLAGFSGNDAPWMTKIAEDFLAHGAIGEPELRRLRSSKGLIKYHRQLLAAIAQKKEAKSHD